MKPLRNARCTWWSLGVLLLAGCGTPARDVFERQCHVLRNQPVSALRMPADAAFLDLAHSARCPGACSDLSPRPSRLEIAGERVKRVVFGPYTAVMTSRAALLLGNDDRPVWAGTIIVPARIEGVVASLFLFSDYPEGSCEDGGIYHIGRLDFRQAVHTYEPLADGYVPFDLDAHKGRRCRWLFDVNGDGTDELLVISPSVRRSLAAAKDLGWQAILYEARPLAWPYACCARASATVPQPYYGLRHAAVVPIGVAAMAVTATLDTERGRRLVLAERSEVWPDGEAGSKILRQVQICQRSGSREWLVRELVRRD